MLNQLQNTYSKFLPPKRFLLLQDLGLLCLRFPLGWLMLQHGLGKWAKYDSLITQFPDPLGLGSGPSLLLALFAEIICSVLIMLGLGTRFAALNWIITMLVAVIIIHGGDPLKQKELALLYLIPAFTLLATGAGRFSLDRWLIKP
jgi:putative oxidoreductase